MEASLTSFRRTIAAASVVIAPLLMSIGDLMHPEEDNDAAKQAAILVEHASRWYAAHLMLFIGILLFIPGLLAITALAARRRSALAYLGRILLLAGVASFAGVFLVETIMGAYADHGADKAAVTDLLDTFQSGKLLPVLAIALLTFFPGVGLLSYTFISAGGFARWPAILLLVGCVFIIIEIFSAQVVSSQIGNIVILLGGIGFARVILTEPADSFSGS